MILRISALLMVVCSDLEYKYTNTARDGDSTYTMTRKPLRLPSLASGTLKRIL